MVKFYCVVNTALRLSVNGVENGKSKPAEETPHTGDEGDVYVANCSRNFGELVERLEPLLNILSEYY
jgi:hypothetical protein